MASGRQVKGIFYSLVKPEVDIQHRRRTVTGYGYHHFFPILLEMNREFQTSLKILGTRSALDQQQDIPVFAGQLAPFQLQPPNRYLFALIFLRLTPGSEKMPGLLLSGYSHFPES